MVGMARLEVVDYRTKVALEGLPGHLQKGVLEEVPEANRKILVDFLHNLVNGENKSPNTKLMYVKHLLYLFRSVKHKAISEITRDDILAYLQSLRKPLPKDPQQKWISTYNTRAVMYVKFWKWLSFPELSPAERKKKVPDVVKDIPLFKKKEKTNVQAKDLWTVDDDAIFLKYCDDPRLQFYHTSSLDTSARPHELLALKVGDVKVKHATEHTYAEVEVGRGGKTKSRTVPLILSLPYFKALLAVHPEPNNPHAFIFRSHNLRSRYRNVPLRGTSLAGLYGELKKKHFPKLLERPDVPPEDKARIRELLQKPWNPYIRRHTSLTEKAKILNEYNLRLHAGWTKTSKMVEVYTHELGGESSSMLLEAYGIKTKTDPTKSILRPRVCPSCSETNKPDAQYCVNSACRMPLTLQAYSETKERERETSEHSLHFMNSLKDVFEQLRDVRKLLEEDKKEKKVVDRMKKILEEKGLWLPNEG